MKKAVIPTARRAVAHYACERGLSQRQACALVGLLPATRVGVLLTQLVCRHGVPARIRADNGPNLISQVLQAWCQGQGVGLRWIQPLTLKGSLQLGMGVGL